MNILWFSPTPSHPQNAGNRSRIFALVKYFQNQGHHITFAYFTQEGNDPEAIAAMETEWDDFYLIPFLTRSRKKSHGELWGTDDWYDRTITDAICSLLRNRTFDVVFCEYIFQSKVLELFPAKCIKVIDAHDRFGGRAELLKRNGIEPDFFYTSPQQEAIALNRADIVIAIQEKEAEYYRSITSAEVVVIGHIIDEPDWQWSASSEGSRLRIGYFGSGNSLNRKSINAFIDAYANNSELVAKSELIIAGSICDRVKLPAHIQATVMGKVKDIADFYRAVDVAVNPMLDGTGLKIKTIEALNFGVPIVSTVSGSDGLPVSRDFHLVAKPAKAIAHLIDACDRNNLERLAVESNTVIAKYQNNLRLQLQQLSAKLEQLVNDIKPKKTVVLVTDAPFWGGKMGSHQRILALCQKLKQEFVLKVFFFGSIWYDRQIEINEAGFNNIVISYKNYNESVDLKKIGLPEQSSFANYSGLKQKRHASFYKAFAQYIAVEQPDSVIIEYVYLAYLKDAIPAKCLSVIDTHDVMCLREYRFYQNGLHHAISMSLSLQQEKTVLSAFDAILAIQDQEYSILQNMLPSKPIILCPHSIDSKDIEPPKEIKTIGFIGANNEANRTGLDWFIKQVWSAVKQLGFTLHIFGSVGKHFIDVCESEPTIKYMSDTLSQSEIYSQVDAMINPVFVGGGLKIKTLEALAYGKVLISTKEGAVGIGEDNNGIIIARDRAEFINAFIYLAQQPELGQKLAIQGNKIVKQKFTPEACYRPLVNLLESAQVAQYSNVDNLCNELPNNIVRSS